MVSNRYVLKAAVVVAALIIVSTVLITTPASAQPRETKWSWEGGAGIGYSNPLLSPAGQILMYSSNNTVHVLSLDGKELWTKYVPWVKSAPQFGPDGTIYLLSRYSYNPVNATTLTALSPAGTVKWTHLIDGISMGMNVADDGTVLLGAMPSYTGQNALVALDPDGSVRWTKMAYNDSTPFVQAIPVGVKGTTFYVAITDQIMMTNSTMLVLRADGFQMRSFYMDFVPSQLAIAGDGTMRAASYSFSTSGAALFFLEDNGNVRWSIPVTSFYGMAVLNEGTVVYSEINQTTKDYLDVKAVGVDGKVRWTFYKGVYSVPVTYLGGVLLATFDSLKLMDVNGKEVWDISGKYYGSPVVSGTSIYAGNSTTLSGIAIAPMTWQWQPLVFVLTIIIASVTVFVLGGRVDRK